MWILHTLYTDIDKDILSNDKEIQFLFLRRIYFTEIVKVQHTIFNEKQCVNRAEIIHNLTTTKTE